MFFNQEIIIIGLIDKVLMQEIISILVVKISAIDQTNHQLDAVNGMRLYEGEQFIVGSSSQP